MAFELRVVGLDAVRRAFARLPGVARRESTDAGRRAAQQAAQAARRSGAADSRQSARVAATVRVEGTTVTAGGGGASGLVFGSEFGGDGRYGWYAQPRYRLSAGRQFRRPNDSYWFFRAVDGPDVAAEYETAADRIVRDWGAG